MTVTVASATFSITGIQSSRADDVIRLSTAPFRMSMPERKTKQNQVGSLYRQINSGSVYTFLRASACIVPMGLATGIMPTYRTWNFCTSSVFGVGNSAKEDNMRLMLINKCVHTWSHHAHRETRARRRYPAAGRRVPCGSCPAEILRP